MPLALCAVLLCGCQGSSDTADTAKIDALNQKLDALEQKVDLLAQNQSIVISNQVVIFNDVEAVRTNELRVLKGMSADIGNIIELEGINEKALKGHLDKIEAHLGIE